MLEIHDWAEFVIGDQVTFRQNKIERQALRVVKHEKENQAMKTICEELGEMGEKIMNLWLRFVNSQDDVASLARQIDKYQAIEKALEYEEAQEIPLFKEFLYGDIENITHPLILAKIENLKDRWHRSLSK
jgi:5'-deoxynucleotidase YfbR-like HD superfamily hydrolase